MKIRTKGILIVSLLITILLVLIIGTGYIIVKNIFINEVTQNLEVIAEIQEKRIQSNVEKNMERLSGVTSRTNLRKTLKIFKDNNEEDLATMNKIINDAKDSIPDFQTIFIVDKNGKIIVSTDENLLGQDFSNEKIFLAGSEKNHIHFEYNVESGAELILHGPLLWEGEFLGVAGIVVDPVSFENITRDYTALGETGETVLAFRNEEGDAEFLHHRRLEEESASRIIEKERVDVPMTQALLGKEVFSDEYVDYRGVPVFSATRYIEGIDWGLVIKKDKQEILAPLVSFERNLLFIGLTVMVISIFGIYFISRSLLRPIETLRAGIEEIEKGNLDYKIVVKSKDEFGDLAQSFNEMASAIKSTYEDVDIKVKEQTKEVVKAGEDLQSQQLAILNVLEDVEEEKLKIVQEKAKSDSLLESIGDGIIATDQDGRITVINKSAEDMLGFAGPEMLDKSIVDVIVLKDQTRKEVPLHKRPMALALSTGKKATSPTGTTYYYERKDKATFPVALTVTPFVVNEKIVGTIVVFRDITIEKEIDRMKTEFVSLASHQLRTPLTSINWFIEMLINQDAGKLNEQQMGYLKEIYKGSKRMVNLVNDLLNVSRLETGRLKIEPKSTDLVGFIEDAIKEMKPLAKLKKCKIEFKKPKKKISKLPIDKTLLNQVVHNMLTNAVKYSRTKSCSVKVELISKDAKNYQLSVTDSGIGIPKSEQPRIFEKFFRADDAVQTAAEGSGLGLYVAKMIMDSSGGKIWFESKKGKGTTFYITIPKKGMEEKQGEKGLA